MKGVWEEREREGFVRGTTRKRLGKGALLLGSCLFLGCSGAEPPDVCPPAGVGDPPFLPLPASFEVRILPRPREVLGWGAPRFTPDGTRISFTFAFTGNPERRDIGWIREDGSGVPHL